MSSIRQGGDAKGLSGVTDTYRRQGGSPAPWVSALHNIKQLSPRELQVFQLLDQGISNQQLADALFISERTVRAHLGNISSKLGLDLRLQLCLASHAYKYGCCDHLA